MRALKIKLYAHTYRDTTEINILLDDKTMATREFIK